MGKLDEFISALPKKLVETDCGPVAGYILSGVANFRGIPYASPPTGHLRWKPPEPPTPWIQPMDATRFGPVCTQDKTLFRVFGSMDEDCLNLNIWAPEKTDGGPFPVMVWLHGGGFSTGSGSLPPYDGAYFASIGIIVVTINYRLNVLGFLALPELSSEAESRTSGNYGIMDQIFALKWVINNIAKFGGDQDNVTIFGESAGGASVAALMSSPLSSGLFQRAIAQSCGNAPSILRKLDQRNGQFDSAESIGLGFAQKLGLDGQKGTLEKMRAIPAHELTQKWFKTVQEDIMLTGAVGNWMLNHLIIDGYVLKDSPGSTFLNGKQHNIPLMTGTTADEGTLFAYLTFGEKPEAGRYHHYLERAFGSAKDKIIEQFGGSEGDSIQNSACNLLGSGFFCGARRLARTMAAVQPQTYRYLFSMPPKFFLYQIPGIPDWKERFGCFHAAEIPYVFNFMLLPGMEDEDRVLAGRMAGYWARFARTGDPNGPAAPHWPKYSQKDEKYLILDNPIDTGQGFKDKECDFVEGLAGM
jgi:para-nitrobenzyl esterase